MMDTRFPASNVKQGCVSRPEKNESNFGVSKKQSRVDHGSPDFDERLVCLSRRSVVDSLGCKFSKLVVFQSFMSR